MFEKIKSIIKRKKKYTASDLGALSDEEPRAIADDDLDRMRADWRAQMGDVSQERVEIAEDVPPDIEVWAERPDGTMVQMKWDPVRQVHVRVPIAGEENVTDSEDREYEDGAVYPDDPPSKAT